MHEPPLISELTDDPDMNELLSEYVAGLGVTAERLGVALAQADSAALRLLGHQLKGSGASYGFPQISEAGARLERLAADSVHGHPSLSSAVEELASLIRRAGAPTSA